MTPPRPIKIAIAALGGQGGGVLAGWIGKLGEDNGFVAQTTSVPGVAQRTGATIYYIELFPCRAVEEKGKEPVLALMPVPGDVDIVIAAELMEAGRAVTRGFVTQGTTLIASTHRDYAISEKMNMGDGRQNPEAIMSAVEKSAKQVIMADMARAAAEAGAVISAVLFGALAGSGALPIEPARYEEQIKKSGRAVDANLRGFARGVGLADGQLTATEKLDRLSSEAPHTMARKAQAFPAAAQFYVSEGVRRAADFQDAAYIDTYLQRLRAVLAVDVEAGGKQRDWRLTRAVAKHLALWMTYEDSIRVADLKTRKSRFDRFRDDVRAEDGQIVNVYEYMHPRVEEFCDILPTGVAKMILRNTALRKCVSALLGTGKRIPTTKLRGFVPLYFLASLRFLRRSSYRFSLEEQRIGEWLHVVTTTAAHDYDLALEIVRLQALIKGYGETHERGLGNYRRIMATLDSVAAKPQPAERIRTLHEAALKDEDGIALTAALSRIADNVEAVA